MKKLILTLALVLVTILTPVMCAQAASVAYPTIVDAQVISVPDLFDFSIEKVEWQNKIRTIKGSGYYSFDSMQEKQLFYVSGTFVNNAMSNLRYDNYISAQLIFRDKYVYDAEYVQYDPDRADRIYGTFDIEPLVVGYPRLVFTVPAQIETSPDSLVMRITIDGTVYEYTVR